jgi:hypothetical protein
MVNNGFRVEHMYGTVLTAAIAISGMSTTSEWELACESPYENLRRDMQVKPQLQWPVPGSPVNFKQRKRPWVSVSVAPDIVSFEDNGYRPGRSFSFSPMASSRGLKGEILKRFGLMEVNSRGFGATIRFSSAPNWAFQVKGRKRLTIAYITRF